MENNKNYFNTYRFYNRKGQRLSIFATTKPGVDSNGTTCGLSIYVVTCSKLDKFSKKAVRTAFEEGQRLGNFRLQGINPVIINLPCTVGDSKRVFMEYCNKNFYKMEVSQIYGTNVGLQFDTLIRRSYDGKAPEVIILPSTVHQIKAVPMYNVVEIDITNLSDTDINEMSDEEINTLLGGDNPLN